MSELKVEKLSPRVGSGTIELGGASDTLKIASGTPGDGKFLKSDAAGNVSWDTVASGDNTPAFAAYISSNFHPGDNSWSKIQFDQEYFDTDHAYDNSTHRFTCPAGKGGKYMFGFYGLADDTGAGTITIRVIGIYLNGVRVRESGITNAYYGENEETLSMTAVLTLVPTDEVEFWGIIDSGSGNSYFLSNSNTATWVTGWRLNGV